jgi:hypothetical protein
MEEGPRQRRRGRRRLSRARRNRRASREKVSFFLGTRDGRGKKNGAQVVELPGGSNDIGDCKP